MSVVDQYLYTAPTRPLRDWLRLQAFTSLVGGPGATAARLFAASVLPAGCDFPAIAFHRLGGNSDLTLDFPVFQFDCWGATPEDAEALAAALTSFLASIPPRTRLASNLVLEGPAVIVDQLYLPAQINRQPRQILRAQLTFAAF